MSGYEWKVAFSQSSASPGWLQIQSNPVLASHASPFSPRFKKRRKKIKNVHPLLPLLLKLLVIHKQSPEVLPLLLLGTVLKTLGHLNKHTNTDHYIKKELVS